jgi:hypothetical protein
MPTSTKVSYSDSSLKNTGNEDKSTWSAKSMHSSFQQLVALEVEKDVTAVCYISITGYVVPLALILPSEQMNPEFFNARNWR